MFYLHSWIQITIVSQTQVCHKGNNESETLVGYLGPETKSIYWTTDPPCTTGRQRACDIIKSAVSTVILDMLVTLLPLEILSINCSTMKYLK